MTNEETKVSTENKEVKDSNCTCLCAHPLTKKILTIALGSFIGCYCALSLFSAIHKPPIPKMPPMGLPPAQQMMYHPHHHSISDFERRPHFDKEKHNFNQSKDFKKPDFTPAKDKATPDKK